MFMSGMQVAPRASVAWQHAYGDVTNDLGLAFASTGTGFMISGVPIARDSALLTAGVDLRIAPGAAMARRGLR